MASQPRLLPVPHCLSFLQITSHDPSALSVVAINLDAIGDEVELGQTGMEL